MSGGTTPSGRASCTCTPGHTAQPWGASSSPILTSAVRTGGVSSTTTYTVTALDQTIAQVRPDGSTTKFPYDPAGNAADRCYWKPGLAVGICQVVGTLGWTNPPGQSTSTAYDARNSRIQQVDGLTNGVTTYDPDHNYAPKAVYLPTGSGRELQSLSAYDVRHRLISITHQLCLVADVNAHTCTSTTAAGSDTYAYDNNDNRTRVAEANGAASTDRFYCYDARDQLIYRNTGTACSSTVKDEAYAYDDAGNRTSALVAASTRTFTYTPDGQLSACANPACTITYDTTGRTAAWTEHDVPTNTDIAWSYTYDSAGRLTSACKAASCSGTGFDRLDFTLWQVQADGALILAASVTYDTWGRPTVSSANGIPGLLDDASRETKGLDGAPISTHIDINLH